MKVSLAMTTYNGEKYLEEQLDSIRLQSVLPDEVIICDDRSTDSTAELVGNYIRRYQLQDTWTFVVNEKNKGYANNFYDAARMCSGDIIFFADQDDIWRLNKIEVMKNAFELNSDVDVLYADYRDYDNEKEHPPASYTEIHSQSTCPVGISKNSIYLQTIGCVMAIRKEFLTYAEPYWYSGFAHDEYAWKIGLCKGKVYHMEEVLIDRRCHGNNVSKKKMRTLESRIRYVSELKKSYKVMLRCLEDEGKKETQEYELVAHNLKGCNLRLGVLKKKKVWLLPLLLINYSDIVLTRRSFFVEAYYAVLGRDA